jgi:hypothetical protein
MNHRNDVRLRMKSSLAPFVRAGLALAFYVTLVVSREARAQDVVPEPPPAAPETALETPPATPAATPAAEPAAASTEASTAAAPGARPTPSAASDGRSITRVYRCIDTISVARGGELLRARSNQIVVVSRTGDVVTLQLRPSIDKGDLPGNESDPPRGRLVLETGGRDGIQTWELPDASVRLNLKVGESEPVAAEALHVNALRECSTILNQARAINVIAGGGESSYQVRVNVNGRPRLLRARQKNGQLWVDWMLSDIGEINVGTGEVVLPLDFYLDKQEPASGMTIDAHAAMKYSSAILGPEGETTITTNLSFKDRDGLTTYARTCTLRYLRVKPDSIPVAEQPGARQLLAAGEMAGDAGVWSRSSTLALLATQGLAGVCDAGLAAWFSQASADTLAAREAPRHFDTEARRSVALVSKMSPDLAPPTGFLSQDVAGGSRIRICASYGTLELAASQVGAASFGESEATAMAGSFALRWKTSPRVYLGLGVDACSVQSREAAGRYWYHVGLGGRFEYDTRTVKLALAAGPCVLFYNLETVDGNVGADVFGYAVAAELEFKIAGKLWLFGEFGVASDADALTMGTRLYGLRYYSRDSLGIHLGIVDAASLEDTKGTIGTVSELGGGGASVVFGVLARW